MKRLASLLTLAVIVAACGDTETKETVVFRNPGQVIQVSLAVATPNPVLSGDDIALALTISSANTLTAVVVDLSTIGGPAVAQLLDDGTAPDLAANDGTYSLGYTVPAGTAPGPRSLPYTVSDSLGFTATGFINLVIQNLAPEIDVPASSVLGPVDEHIGPLETLALRISATDPDGDTSAMTVTANLAAAGGTVNEPLAFNATSGLFELDFQVGRDVAPGIFNVVVVATDTLGASANHAFEVTLHNWTGLGGSADGHGISDSLGWSLGSACVTDAQGRIYVAYSRRVNVPTTISGSGWIYSVYARRYDPLTNVWSGLAGSDSGLGLNLNTAGRTISSGYMGNMAFYQEQHQASNKAAVYVLFHGDPDPDSTETLWDSFLVRWNITDNQWQALGTGTDASDYVTGTSTPAVDDVGGFTKWGARAQEPVIAFDPATDDVYVAYHAQMAPSSTYAVFVKRFNRALGAWQDIEDGTPANGVSDAVSVNTQFPGIAIRNGKLYLSWQIGASQGSVQMREYDIGLGTWSAIATVYDATAPSNANAVNPALVIDSQGRLVLSYSVKSTGDQRLEIARVVAADWALPGTWQGLGAGGERVVSIQPNTNTQNIRTRLALGPNDEIWTAWNQVHAGATGTVRNIFARKYDGTAWREVYGSFSQNGITHDPNVTDWLPYICVDPQGRPVISWDTYWGGGTSNDYRKVYVKTIR